MSAAAVLDGGYAAPGGYLGAAAHHQEDPRPTVLVTTVDIGEGEAGRIEVRLGDHPVDVARAFCARHGLPDTIVLPLAQHLEENLAENAAAEAAATLARSGSYGDGMEDDAEDSDEDYGYSRDFTPPAVSRSASVEVPAPSYGGSRPGSGPSGGSQQQAWDLNGTTIRRPPAHHLQVETSSRSTGMLGTRPPAPEQQEQPCPRPQTADAAVGPSSTTEAGAASQDGGRLTYRPASVHSARGAEYFNQAPSSSSGKSGGSDPDSGGGLLYHGVGSGGHVPAHTRLYADHFRKQQRLDEERRLRDLEIQLKTEQVHIAPVSNKLASHRTAGSYRNYGERLYVEGRLEAMKKEQLVQRFKEDEARAELEQYTFQPEISKLAQQLKQGEGGTAGVGSAYQRLYQRGVTAKRQVGAGRQTTAERMEAIRREQEEAEVKECSFRPHINTKSARMVEHRQQILKESGISGYEQLYADGQRRQTKLQQLAARPPEEATFKPRVNTSSVVLKKLLEGRQAEQPLGGSIDVADRLLERGRRYQEKLAAAQKLLEEQPRDPATGQPLFRPKTHRPPQWERNPEGAPIGEYLYSIKAEWDERAKRTARATRRRTQQDAASTFVNSRSERLVDRLKRERFRAIFDYLRRGQPAPVLNLLETVQDETFMDTIDPEVRADIEYAGRLLQKAIKRRQRAELQDSATSAPNSSRTSAASYAQSTNGELDSAGFVALMEEVIGRTKGLTRQYLLPMPSTRQKFEEPTFRPAIDPHSQMLAARLRPESLPTYEILYKTAEELAAKRGEMQRAAEAAKLRDCSFRPSMVAQPKAKEGRAIKLAAELRSKHTSEAEDGTSGAANGPLAAREQPPEPLATAAGSAAPGSVAGGGNGAGELHFDALERQINDALVRLSLSEEQVAASLRQAAAAEGPAAASLPPMQVGQSLDANGYRLDYRTILSSPTPDDLTPLPGAGGSTPSQGFFSPTDDAGRPASASPLEPQQDSSVTWADNSQEVVAQVVDGGEAGAVAGDLLGLDLHALASTDLPEHGVEAALATAGQTAASGSKGAQVPSLL